MSKRLVDMKLVLVHETIPYEVKFVALTTGYNVGHFAGYKPGYARFAVKGGKYEQCPEDYARKQTVPYEFLKDGGLTKELKLYRVYNNGRKRLLDAKWIDRKMTEY